MKFRWVDKMEKWTHLQYYTGRKNGAVVEVKKDKNSKYSFFVNREKDDFRFNSLWGSFPNENIQKLLNELPNMIFESDVKALEFISDWVDKNVPKLSKSE
jgi:hypothetical protein